MESPSIMPQLDSNVNMAIYLSGSPYLGSRRRSQMQCYVHPINKGKANALLCHQKSLLLLIDADHHQNRSNIVDSPNE